MLLAVGTKGGLKRWTFCRSPHKGILERLAAPGGCEECWLGVGSATKITVACMFRPPGPRLIFACDVTAAGPKSVESHGKPPWFSVRRLCRSHVFVADAASWLISAFCLSRPQRGLIHRPSLSLSIPYRPSHVACGLQQRRREHLYLLCILARQDSLKTQLVVWPAPTSLSNTFREYSYHRIASSRR